MNYFMNEKEDIYVMKMINDLNRKFVNPVARQDRSPYFDRSTHLIRILGCSRRPQSRSS